MASATAVPCADNAPRPATKGPATAELFAARSLKQVFAALLPLRRPAAGGPPRIEAGTRAHDYALLRTAGDTKAEACRRLGVSERQAQRWQAELCDQGRAYFGREVEYFFVAAYAVSEEWRLVVEGAGLTPN